LHGIWTLVDMEVVPKFYGTRDNPPTIDYPHTHLHEIVADLLILQRHFSSGPA
jgi:hypothetical protein